MCVKGAEKSEFCARFQSGIFLKTQIQKRGNSALFRILYYYYSKVIQIMHGDVLSARSVNGATIVHVESVDGVRTMSGGRILSNSSNSKSKFKRVAQAPTMLL